MTVGGTVVKEQSNQTSDAPIGQAIGTLLRREHIYKTFTALFLLPDQESVRKAETIAREHGILLAPLLESDSGKPGFYSFANKEKDYSKCHEALEALKKD